MISVNFNTYPPFLTETRFFPEFHIYIEMIYALVIERNGIMYERMHRLQKPFTAEKEPCENCKFFKR